MTARKKMPRLAVGQRWARRDGERMIITSTTNPGEWPVLARIVGEAYQFHYTRRGVFFPGVKCAQDLARLLSQPKPRAKKRRK